MSFASAAGFHRQNNYKIVPRGGLGLVRFLSKFNTAPPTDVIGHQIVQQGSNPAFLPFTQTANPSPSESVVLNPSAQIDNAFYCPDSYDFDPDNPAVDFTMEGWQYLNVWSGRPRILMGLRHMGGSFMGSDYVLSMTGTGNNTGYYSFDYPNGPVSSNTMDTNGLFFAPQNQWVYLAACRAGNTYYLFVNGTLYKTNGGQGWRNPKQKYRLVLMSENPPGIDGWNGLMSDMRLTIGKALYTSNFTPPTAPLSPYV